MYSWIWRRALRLVYLSSFVGCCFFVAVLTYNALTQHASVNGQLEKEGKEVKQSLYRRPLHQIPSEVKPGLARISSLKIPQPATDISKEGDKSTSPAASPKGSTQDNHPKTNRPAMRVSLDRYSIVPIDSSVSLPFIDGTQYFDEFIKKLYLSCKTPILRHPGVYGRCRNFTNMRFINGSRLVAFVSFPGSGSTWARSALEQATGIYTGSVYCDSTLKSKGFLGEKVISTNVLTVKTHMANVDLFPRMEEFLEPTKFKNISAVILLVRNPLDSLISLWNWMHGGHTATASPHSFGNFSRWRKFVDFNAKEFTKLVHYWLEEAGISSVLVIKYEDMLINFDTQLRRMLDFLQVAYTDKDIDCVANNKLESYHRQKRKPFDHYNPADRKLVLTNLMSIETLLNKHGVSYKDVLVHYNITS